MLVVLEFLNDVQLSPTMGIPGWLLSIHENQRCCTLLIQHVCGSVPAPDTLGTAQLMGSTQGRYEYMTKESPAPTLKAELEISSVLISSPGLSAQLSLWIQITLIPAFIPLQPVSAHVFYPPESSCPNSAFISVGDVHLGHFVLHPGDNVWVPRVLNVTPGTSGEGKKAAVCILNPENIF